ncbi:MAG: hypothetical protein WC850_03665 [Candidatus Gracilibacteria bacterium]
MLYLYIFSSYLLFCKLLPYFVYPNYFKKSKIENYLELIQLSSELKGKNKIETIENIYEYFKNTYSGKNKVLKLKNLLTVLYIGDFKTNNILSKKVFLWCHTQNRLFKSILVNTKMFKESEIITQKRYFISIFIHQWLYIKLEDKEVKIDPYFGIFEKK